MILEKSVQNLFKIIFHDSVNIDIINRFEVGGLNMKEQEKEGASDKFAWLTFVITGTLPTKGIKECLELIKLNAENVLVMFQRKPIIFWQEKSQAASLIKLIHWG